MAMYNKQNFYNMKRNAVRNAGNTHEKTVVNDTAEVNCTEEKKLIGQQDKICEEKTNNNGLMGIADGIFESLGIKKDSVDSEKIIIVIMIIMLAREGADLKLLLALGYILM